jgi:TRAP-type mannitol/chloroaromatic compound transport system permease small subunit
MTYLIKLSRAIDKLNNWLGKMVSWLILIAVLLSAGNAVVRYAIGDSSNAFLELQWVLIAAVFLIGAGYTLLHQQHVKVDIVYARFSRRTQLWIDIFGTVFFLFPMAFIVMWLSWPVFVAAYLSGEVSTNTGGLTLWWARLLVPVGFFLLLLQGLSELIKRIAILRGDIEDTLAAEPALPVAAQPQQTQQSQQQSPQT